MMVEKNSNIMTAEAVLIPMVVFRLSRLFAVGSVVWLGALLAVGSASWLGPLLEVESAV